MGSPSTGPNDERERTKRLAASAAELLQLVTVLTSRDSNTARPSGREHWRSASGRRGTRPAHRRASLRMAEGQTKLRLAPPTGTAGSRTRQDRQRSRKRWRRSPSSAIGNLKDAFERKATTKATPIQPSCRSITAALESVRTCRDHLTRLDQDRNLAASAWFADPRISPTAAGNTRTTPAAPTWTHPASSPRIMPAPAPPPSPAASPTDDQLHRRPLE